MMSSKDPEGDRIRLVIVRHGQSTANLAGIIQGQDMDPSIKLTELGQAQALCTGACLSSSAWWRFYSSDIPRAVETSRLMLAGVDPETTPLLREYALGVREGQPLCMSEKAALASYYKIHGLSAPKPPKSESSSEVAARGAQFLRDVLSVAASEESAGLRQVLIVSHSGFIRVFLRDVCGVLVTGEIGNLSVSSIDVVLPSKQGLRKGEKPVFHSLQIGDTSHLSSSMRCESAEGL